MYPPAAIPAESAGRIGGPHHSAPDARLPEAVALSGAWIDYRSAIVGVPPVPAPGYPMNCIDAIEGMAKEVIDRIHGEFAAASRDDSEYVRAVRTVIEGAEKFVTDNPEIYEEPKIFSRVLYRYAKQRWLLGLTSTGDPDLAGSADTPPPERDDEYQRYYYDFLYDYGNYPP